MWRGLLLFLLAACVHCNLAKPLGYHRQLSPKDVISVESLRRDVRAPAPFPFATEVEDLLSEGNAPQKGQATKQPMKNTSGKSDEGGYYKTYGSDAEGEKGYLQEMYSKGNHGYKTLDTFHKQDGDKYAFEKQVAYGKAREDEKSSQHGDSGSSSKKTGDHQGAGTIVDTHYAAGGGEDHANEEGDHDGYSEGDGGAHYTDHGPESSSYGHSESYTSGNGGDGSYETHGSYSKNHGGEHGADGGHYY